MANFSTLPWDSSVFGSRDYVSMVWYILIAVFGTLFNGVAIFTLVMMKKTRLDQYWLALLATSDFLLSSCNGSAKAIRHVRFLLEGEQVYDTEVSCNILGAFNYIFLGITTVVLTAIAVDRCLIIVKQSKYTSFTHVHLKQLVIFSYILIPLLPTAAIIAPSLRKGCYFYFDMEQVTCTMATNIYKMIIVSAFVYIPLTIMVAMYTFILIYYFRQQRRITDKNSQSAKREKRDMRLVQTLATMVLVYVICYTPYTVIGFGRFITYYSLRIGSLLIYSTVITDPVVYFVLNKNMRTAVLLAFRFKRFNNNDIATRSTVC